MSGEIDTSLLLTALRRRWWLVLISIVAAVAIAVGIGLTRERGFEATNVLLVQSPRYQWRFANEITAITDLRRDFQREVLAIARSDEIAQAAAARLQTSGADGAVTPHGLKNAVTVRAGDGNTIVVAATSNDREQAAAYASAWTQELISAARNVYGSVRDLAAFQAELETLDARLQAAENALAATRARTGLYANTNIPDEAMRASLNLQRLNQLNASLAEYLTALEAVRLIQDRLAQAGPGTDLAQLPWEMLSGPLFDQRAVLTADIARASLNDLARLAGLLRQEESALQATADSLASQAVQLQTALATDWQEYEDVLRRRNQARDAYQILARKVNELTLQERIDPSLLTIVGSAEPLVSQARAPMLGLAATAAVAGLIVGVLLAVWLEMAGRRKHASSYQPARQQA